MSARPDGSSDLSQDQQDDDDEEHEAQPAARPIAPAAAVAPARQGAHQEQDQYDQQNGSECHHALLFVSMSAIADFVATSVGCDEPERPGQVERVDVGPEAVAPPPLSYTGARGPLNNYAWAAIGGSLLH